MNITNVSFRVLNSDVNVLKILKIRLQTWHLEPTTKNVILQYQNCGFLVPGTRRCNKSSLARNTTYVAKLLALFYYSIYSLYATYELWWPFTKLWMLLKNLSPTTLVSTCLPMGDNTSSPKSSPGKTFILVMDAVSPALLSCTLIFAHLEVFIWLKHTRYRSFHLQLFNIHTIRRSLSISSSVHQNVNMVTNIGNFRPCPWMNTQKFPWKVKRIRSSQRTIPWYTELHHVPLHWDRVLL